CMVTSGLSTLPKVLYTVGPACCSDSLASWVQRKEQMQRVVRSSAFLMQVNSQSRKDHNGNRNCWNLSQQPIRQIEVQENRHDVSTGQRNGSCRHSRFQAKEPQGNRHG